MSAGEIRLAPEVLQIDPAAEVERIATWLRAAVGQTFHRRGAVVALSGGVDSSVCAALAVRALGARRVYGLLMPERDSSSSSLELGRKVASSLKIEHHVEQIGPTLEAIGCYRRRDEAIRTVFANYRDDWKSKIVIRGLVDGQINRFHLVIQSPEGETMERRLGLSAYLQIVAATSFKQRIRKTIEYFHADRLNYAVVGTPSRAEYDQGFFVKNGDGSADVKPIAHLYKTQVYSLARHFDLPAEVVSAVPTTDTYTLPQSQEEFYFVLPYEQMDLALWAHDHDVPSAELAAALGISMQKAEAVYHDIVQKRRTTRYQHARPELVETIGKIGE
jgi:NAD+ synthase